MPLASATWVPRKRTAAAAVVVCCVLTLGAGLSGCAYEYNEGSSSEGSPSSSASTFTNPAIPKDPGLDLPVSGAELEAWVKQALPDAAGQVFQTGYGSLDADEEQNETTTVLPQGSYSVTLACRSSKRVSFNISNGENDVVDLTLRCGASRVNVISLPADAILTVKVDADAPSNFAYRVSRI
ncbi:hypothetical protein BJG92_02135 [Arthrobacter sp. SO5]|uniref:DUF6023 family protein n=1 Tax=Arthrobacter sp. SO5 TaxID=1897055 RepID=UPI001E52B224|nr:DUF6023 family protein [Arthrobacter sp. SO5]MCB5274598.1 hypothetical protein [Arthrobacter sp. SO5]